MQARRIRVSFIIETRTFQSTNQESDEMQTMSHLRSGWQFPRLYTTLFACLVMLLLAAPTLPAAGQGTEPVTDPATGVTTYPEYEGIFASHVDGEVLYAQVPPVGGPHNGVWQDCGYYAAPIYNWHGVHSLEHGAIWITYDPNLSADDKAVLANMSNQGHLLITPYPGLTDPVVASAWGRQVRLEGVNDPRLQEFINAFRQNPETAPEPGALCSLGTMNTMEEGDTLQTEPSVISGTPDEVAAAEATVPEVTGTGTGTGLREQVKDRN